MTSPSASLNNNNLKWGGCWADPTAEHRSQRAQPSLIPQTLSTLILQNSAFYAEVKSRAAFLARGNPCEGERGWPELCCSAPGGPGGNRAAQPVGAQGPSPGARRRAAHLMTHPKTPKPDPTNRSTPENLRSGGADEN